MKVAAFSMMIEETATKVTAINETIKGVISKMVIAIDISTMAQDSVKTTIIPAIAIPTNHANSTSINIIGSSNKQHENWIKTTVNLLRWH